LSFSFLCFLLWPLLLSELSKLSLLLMSSSLHQVESFKGHWWSSLASDAEPDTWTEKKQVKTWYAYIVSRLRINLLIPISGTASMGLHMWHLCCRSGSGVGPPKAASNAEN
jgi:hypothetical protein